MASGKSMLQILNIRRDESWLVGQLFFLQFFQGVGVALFFTASTALFLEKLEATELPKVFLLAAGLLLITGVLYSRMEHALSVRNLIGVVIAIMAVSIGVFRIGLSTVSAEWFLYITAAWYYILYLLSNLEFWGLSALLFDIRQSKRLFGIISAGDIPAKFIGYFSAYLIVPYIGSANMLYLAMLSIALSLIFWHRLARAGRLDLHVDHHHSRREEIEDLDFSVAKMIRGLFGSSMVFSVAILSFVVATVSTIITFVFYAEVKERIHHNQDLARFIGLFYSVGRIIAIFIKLVLTGKLTEVIGIKGSLLITPVILLIVILVVSLFPALSGDSIIILYAFGIMYIVADSLKSAIQDPVFIAVMQPLKKSLRLRGHTVVKGVMDPFGLAFSGLIIYAVVYFTGGINIHALCYILVALVMVWIACIFAVNRNYLRSLIEGLNNRYVNGREMDLTQEDTLQLIFDKIPTAKTGEAIYLMELASKLPDDKKDVLIKMGLNHREEEVRIEAMKLIESQKIRSALPDLQQIISSDPSRKILAHAIQAICIVQHEEDVEDFSYYLDSSDLYVVQASVTGLLRNGSINAVVSAGQKLQQLRDSADMYERAIAAEVIGALKVRSFYKALLNLLDDPSDHVVSAAITAAGKLQSEKLVQIFINKVYSKQFERRVLEALYDSGQIALPAIHDVLSAAGLSKSLCLKLFHLTAKIGGPEAQQILESHISVFPDYRYEIYQALHHCRFRVHDDNRSIFDGYISEDIAFSMHLLDQISLLQTTGENQIIESALLSELNQAKARLLWLFSFIYDEEKIIRARNGFQFNNQESIANAQEILDLTLPKEVASKFNMLFEQATIAERIRLIKPFIKRPATSMDDIASEVLGSGTFKYNLWTKAVVLHNMSRSGIERNIELINANFASQETLLKETCDYALKKLSIAV